MYQFIESICCLEGEAKLLRQHQARVDSTFANFFPQNSPLDLNSTVQNIPSKGKYKCRLLYDAVSFSVEYQPYKTSDISSLQVVHDNHIDYKFKSTNRSPLDSLYEQRSEADDIIIIRNGLVTDSYYANLAFFDGTEWWTPESPLLEGIKRAFLLDKNRIKTKNIYEKDLSSFIKVSLINAMLDLGEVEIPVDRITP